MLAFKQTVQITTQVDSKYISKVKNQSIQLIEEKPCMLKVDKLAAQE